MNQPIRLLIISAALALLATSACTVQGGARSRAAYQAPGPNLVAIGSGVYVVENHSQSVFYSDGAYWMAGNGGWYRSSHYNRGWGYVDYQYVPRRVIQIREPRSYTRYRARPGMQVQRASAIDHRGRQAHTRRAPQRSNTRVRATRGRAPAPAHSARPRRARPAKPAARPVKPAVRRPASDRRDRKSDRRKKSSY